LALLAALNWEDHPVRQDLTCRSFGIAAGEYWISDFWRQRLARSTHLTNLGEFEIPTHGCKLLAVRPIREVRYSTWDRMCISRKAAGGQEMEHAPF
jgi:hypothetical protein